MNKSLICISLFFFYNLFSNNYCFGSNLSSLKIDTTKWKSLTNEETYADNFQDKQCDTNIYKHCRIVTVFKIPMSDDRKTGIKISENEYVDVMVVHPGFLTVQVRLNKGEYWVMCRVTFQNNKSLAILKNRDAFPNIEKQKILLSEYQNEIDNIRYLLKNSF